MTNTTFKNLFLLIISSLLIQGAFAQQNPWNLGFELYNPQNQSFTPWTKTSFSDLLYEVEIDSSTVQQGKYSLRIQYNPGGKKLSEGQIVNSMGLDVPCKTLTVSFYAKLTGPVKQFMLGFYAAQDRGEKTMETKSFKITEAQDWTLFTGEIDMSKLTFPIDHLRISGFYKGEGSLWLDNITILADGKPLQETNSFCKPLNENIQPLTPEQINHLALLGQTWGFLKYFHPLVAKGKFNWDMELLRMVPLVKNTADHASFSQTILHWIDSLGVIDPCSNCNTDIPEGTLTYNIDLAWMKDQHFSRPLQDKLQFLLANRHKGPGQYAKYEGAGNISVLAESEYKWRDGIYPHEGFRLLTLYRYWNIIHYFSPYKNIIGRNWNDVLYEYIPKMAEAKDSLSYNISLAHLINSVNDSHASSYNPVIDKQFDRYLPVITYFIGDDLVITGNYNDSLAAIAGLQKGDVIEKLNGLPTKQVIEGRKSMTGGSNESATLRTMTWFNRITGGNTPQIELTISRNGQSFIKTVQRYPYAQFNYKEKEDSTLWKILPGNIGFVNMGQLEVKHVDSMMQALKNTRTIIFDTRNYPRNTIWPIATYLHDKLVTFALLTQPNLDYPGAFKWKSFENKCGPTNKNKQTFLYTGKIVVLVNEMTQSHAEWTTMAFQTVPGCVTIGSQTAGADGNISRFFLPGGYRAIMTGLGVFYPDQSPTQRVGVRIDKIVRPTPQGIAAGRDEVLEAAITHINAQKP
jgi:C-terminal processing protease CtpA/Prc